MEAKYLVAEEELFMAKKKASDLESQNKAQTEEASVLKKKLKDLSDQNRKTTLTLSKSSDNLLTMSNLTTHDRLKKYLE